MSWLDSGGDCVVALLVVHIGEFGHTSELSYDLVQPEELREDHVVGVPPQDDDNLAVLLRVLVLERSLADCDYTNNDEQF